MDSPRPVERRWRALTRPLRAWSVVWPLAAAWMLGAPVLGEETPSPAWSSFTGRIVYDGDPPDAKAFPGMPNVVDESLLVHRSGGVANVFVWVKKLPAGAAAEAALPMHASWKALREIPAKIDNVDSRFDPHAQVAWTERKLTLVNSESSTHAVDIKTLRNPTVSRLLLPAGTYEHAFEQSETVPMPVVCGIHPWMQAWILPLEHPYGTVTSAKGEFTLPYLPRGEITLCFWHERAGYIRNVIWRGSEHEWKKGRLTLAADEPEIDLGEIRVPAAAFAR